MFNAESIDIGAGNHGLLVYTKECGSGHFKFVEKITSIKGEIRLCKRILNHQLASDGDFSVFPMIMGVVDYEARSSIFLEYLEGAGSSKLKPKPGLWDGDESICKEIAEAVSKLRALEVIAGSKISLDRVYSKASLSNYFRLFDSSSAYINRLRAIDKAFLHCFEDSDIVL